MRFQGRTAVVACGGSGAGIACAKRFYEEGANVALYYSEPERLAGLADCFSHSDAEQHLLLIPVSDFRSREELSQAAEQVLSHFKAVDIAVTAITTDPQEPASTMSEEEYQRVLHTIASGALWSLQPLMESMIERNYGRIVLISSLAGRTNLPGVPPVYAAAHAALGGMARNIGCTMGVHRIIANAVAVGPLEDGSYSACLPDTARGLLPGRALGRLEDVAGAVEYLTSELASWTTGETLDLNGGQFMV
ncbi:MAG: SDR family oxidoreductase [Lachnospiraceae bacterium]|nr:SDR family oxidoreductase [Lachnospiraceae bacterium]